MPNDFTFILILGCDVISCSTKHGHGEELCHKFSQRLIKNNLFPKFCSFFNIMNKLMFSMNDWKHYNKHSYFLYRSVMRLGPIPEA